MYFFILLLNRVSIEQEAKINSFITLIVIMYLFIIYNLTGFSFVFQIKYLSYIHQALWGRFCGSYFLYEKGSIYCAEKWIEEGEI